MADERPEISGNDVADEIEAGDARHAAREQAVRRACEVMGWDYHQSPVWAGLRKVAMADAVAISVEKLNQLVDAIHEANRKANAAQTLNSNQRQMADQAEIEKGALQLRIDNAVAELDSLADLLADSEELPVDQTPAVRLINEILEALSGLPRSEHGAMEMTADEANREVGKRTPLEWDDSSPDPWATRPKQ